MSLLHPLRFQATFPPLKLKPRIIRAKPIRPSPSCSPVVTAAGLCLDGFGLTLTALRPLLLTLSRNLPMLTSTR